MSRTNEYSAVYYDSVNTSSVTVDVASLTNAPTDGTSRKYGKPARALIVSDVTSGTTVEVTRPDGTQVVLTRYAVAGVEYPCQVTKVRPGTSVDEYILLW